MSNLNELSLKELLALIKKDALMLEGLEESKNALLLGEVLSMMEKAIRKAKWRLLDFR